jgi:uncharacterized protein (TIGR03086 family)
MVSLEPAAARLGALVRGVRDDQLAAPTPCPGYTLGDLLEHVGGLALAFRDAATKATDGANTRPPSGDASRLRDDWRDRIPADLNDLALAWREPEAWEGTTRIAGAEMPAAVVGRVAVNELVVHGWDVARASDQPFEADADLVEICFEFIGPLSEPGMEPHRQPAFGPVVGVGDDAPPLTRLHALNGRDAGRSPG